MKWIRVGAVEVVRSGHLKNIFVRKSQQDSLMHASNVCDRNNSAITPQSCGLTRVGLPKLNW